MATLLHKCFVKGTTGEVEAPRYSHNWAFARRAWFKIYNDHFVCGDWNIPFSTIDGATLYRIRQLFIPGHVLHLRVGSKSYQFGFNPWCRIDRHLPIKFDLTEARLAYSTYSAIIRLVILAAFVSYVVWRLVR